MKKIILLLIILSLNSNAEVNSVFPFYSSNLWGVADYNGTVIVDPKYKMVGEFRESMAPAIKDKLWGYIDTNGQEAIPFVFMDADSFREGVARVKETMEYGYINSKGIYIIPPIFDSASHFNNGLAEVKVGEILTGIIDTNFTFILPLSTNKIFLTTSGLVGFCGNDNKIGFINTKKSIIIPADFSSIGLFEDNLCKVVKNGNTSFINNEGEIVITNLNVDYFSEGLAHVCMSNKWGFMDKKGQLIIPYIYDTVTAYHEGFASVSLNKKFGSIDKKGNLVIPVQYDKSIFFENGIARLVKDNQIWYINNKFVPILGPFKE